MNLKKTIVYGVSTLSLLAVLSVSSPPIETSAST